MDWRLPHSIVSRGPGQIPYFRYCMTVLLFLQHSRLTLSLSVDYDLCSALDQAAIDRPHHVHLTESGSGKLQTQAEGQPPPYRAHTEPAGELFYSSLSTVTSRLTTVLAATCASLRRQSTEPPRPATSQNAAHPPRSPRSRCVRWYCSCPRRTPSRHH